MRGLSILELRQVLMIAIALLVLTLGLFFALRGQLIASLKAEVQKIQSQQERLIEENHRLKELLSRKDDLEFLEYLARRELGLIKPGEEKYILIERAP